MSENIFNNYSLNDEQILNIIEQSIPVINRNSKIDGNIDEDLKQEMIIAIYEQLKKKI
ncbi:MAG: hypothetical protein Q4G09_02685 [Clostridia bacterium]|nr:hypothetical protein [Clostridia bacterium]